MYVKVYNSVTEVDEKAWDAIVESNRLICTHKYLEAVEKSDINDCRYYYPVLYEDDKIVAHACVYSISTELDTFAQGVTKKTISIIRRYWNNFFILRSLECGTPIATGTTISFRKGTDRIGVLERMCREVECLARNLGVKIVLFRDFYDEELDSFDHLTELGYTRIHNLPSTRIEIKWKSFDEYLDSMRSHYKWKIIKRMRKCYEGDISIRLLSSFSRYADELGRLWTNVYNHATEYRRERLTPSSFVNIDKCLGDRSGVIVAEQNGHLIGFTLLLFDDETLIPMYTGLDYTFNAEHCIYFNLLYKVVEIGIERSMKSIDMGITTLAPKKDMGAVVVPMNMYMKHFNPLLSKIVPRMFDVMTPQDDTSPRRVFKSRKHEHVINC